MKKINANLIFYIYFIAITYAFAKDINILNSSTEENIEYQIYSSVIFWMKNHGIVPDLIRTYLGTLIAVFFSNMLSEIIQNNKTYKSTVWRITPLIFLHIHIIYSYVSYIGISKIAKIYFLLIFCLLLIPSFVFLALTGKKEANNLISNSDDIDIIGIKIYNFYWLIFPLYYYAIKIINSWLSTLEMLKYQFNFLGSIFIIISAIIPIAYLIPITIVFKILKGEFLKNKGKSIIFISNISIISIGYLICGLIEKSLNWIKIYFRFIYA